MGKAQKLKEQRKIERAIQQEEKKKKRKKIETIIVFAVLVLCLIVFGCRVLFL